MAAAAQEKIEGARFLPHVATSVWKRAIVLSLSFTTGTLCVMMLQILYVVALHVSGTSLLQHCL